MAEPSSAPATVPRLNPAWKRGHDRAALALLDRGALDVHGDVPGAVAEADEEQPGDDGRHPVRVAERDGREADRQQDRHREDRARRARAG